MPVTVLMLGAGKSKRFGSAKQLANINGKPLVVHCLEQYLINGKPIKGIDKVHIVLGCYKQQIQTLLPIGVEPLEVDSWDLGMGHSLAEGICQLEDISQTGEKITHILITLADQVAINIGIVNRILLTSSEHPSKIVAAKFKDSIGAPVIFPAAYFKQLKELSGDRGAKRVIQQNLDNVMCLAIPEAALDIDTPEDLLSYKTNRIH